MIVNMADELFALFALTDRTVRIGPRSSVNSGWSAELQDSSPRAVRLAPVHSWRDIADHAVTFLARVSIDPPVRDEMMRAGCWAGGPHPVRR